MGEPTEDEAALDAPGGDPVSEVKADGLHSGGRQPIGRQAEVAETSSTGTIPHGMVASTSGLVPVSAITDSPEKAAQLLEDRRKDIERSRKRGVRTRLTNEQLAKMGAAEIRAVAHDRNYDIGTTAGARGARSLFKEAQDNDKYLQKLEGEDSGELTA